MGVGGEDHLSHEWQINKAAAKLWRHNRLLSFNITISVSSQRGPVHSFNHRRELLLNDFLSMLLWLYQYLHQCSKWPYFPEEPCVTNHRSGPFGSSKRNNLTSDKGKICPPQAWKQYRCCSRWHGSICSFHGTICLPLRHLHPLCFFTFPISSSPVFFFSFFHWATAEGRFSNVSSYQWITHFPPFFFFTSR